MGSCVLDFGFISSTVVYMIYFVVGVCLWWCVVKVVFHGLGWITCFGFGVLG